MERITMSIDERLARDFDRLCAQRGYASRSEAIRDLLRREVEQQRQAGVGSAHCVASLSYVYSPRERRLAERLAQTRHDHHDLVISAMRVTLDHDNCLETVVLKGPVASVRGFADSVCAERGVRHGRISLVSVEVGDTHAGAGAHRHHGHLHLMPRS